MQIQSKINIIDLQKQRMSICENCEYYKFKKCSNCGCVMFLKTWLRNEKCPIGKWK